MARSITATVLIGFTALLAGCGGGGGGGGGPISGTDIFADTMVVLGYNDLGMHCMNQDFSEIMILPPFNNLRAQVIDRSGEEPRIVTGGVNLTYSVLQNTHSADKTNFWTYAFALLGVGPAPNVGLTGNGMSGTMSLTGQNDWVATGIPITPLNDSRVLNAYPLGVITVMSGGTALARTQATVPVSWEISCNLCHDSPGVSTATDILRAHDRLHGTTLEQQKPVACGRCHAQPPLASILPGDPARHTLSRAMHGAHASRMGSVGVDVVCYACHPGIQTQCLRDVHASKGMTCLDCHESMEAVADPGRRPWVDEPRCGDCHTRAGFEFEQANTLFRDSKGHHQVHCAACHGSPHAVVPTTVQADNLQSLALQGHAGPIDTCTVCHRNRPDDAFTHRLSGG